MTLGIVVLILTVYVKAVFPLIYFTVRENRKYLAITLFVLMIPTASLLAH